MDEALFLFDKIKMDLDNIISMAEIKANLRKKHEDYPIQYTRYLADRLDDELSPKDFFWKCNEIIREMCSGISSDPTKPVPISVHTYAKTHGSFLISDFGMSLSQVCCPPEFAKAVRYLHKETYIE